MTQPIPAFAVVGAVNHGKSSVVAALAESDDVRISPMPGETVAVRRFGLRDLLVLFDTPGFQNARKALAEIEGMPSDGAPLARFARFVERHRGNPEFEAECRLLQPIVDGAGIIYVVDGSRPLRDIHRCEMEVLRLTGAPRLAIVNRVGDDDHVAEWTGALAQHFNLVRAFDAHRASHADRRDLVEALAIIERGWKDRLLAAVDAMEADRTQRIEECAAAIAAFLVDVLPYAVTVPLDAALADDARRALAHEARAAYQRTLADRERDAHGRLIAIYAHRHVVPDAMPADLFADDLFAEETWRLFGLDVRQLVGLSTVAGGLAGAGVDAATLGHSLGLGAAVGAAAGGGGAWLLGKRRPEIAIGWPGGMRGLARALVPKAALRLGGGDLVVGPLKAENFPWILVDRALCVFAAVHARSHARRDDAIVDMASLRTRLEAAGLVVARWPDDERRDGQRAFRTLRAGRRPGSDEVAALRVALETALFRVADAEERIAMSPARGDTGS